MKNITLPQALILIACMGVPIAAYKLLGSPEAAAALTILGMVVNFLLGRDSNPPPPSDPPSPPSSGGGKVIGFVAGTAACLALTGCLVVDPKDATDEDAIISKCAAEARAEHYVGGASDAEATRVFRKCLAREGIQ